MPQPVRQPEHLPLEVLQRHFGFESFRGVQGEIIRHVLSDQHAMVIMPTGGGKSLCFQIPALCYPNAEDLTVVISPLIALMQDQVDVLNSRDIDAALINSSLDRETRLQRYRELAENRFRIIYVTPERFRKADFCEAIQHRKVRLLAVDEAHCVSQWGHDFRPDYSRLAEIRRLLREPTTIALTATATAECRRDIYAQMGIEPSSIRLFHEGVDRPSLQLDVSEVCDDESKVQAIEEILNANESDRGSAILYFSLIKTLERFSDLLRKLGRKHVCYHGDLPRHQRRSIQERFMKGDAKVVLATNAFGMGIDKEDIRVVIHVETPDSIEAYYQEIGRAGRDGKPSICHWLYDPNDLLIQMQFIEWANPDADFYGRVYSLLKEHPDKCQAYGLDWMNERIQKVSRHDHRLATVISMLDRYGVVAGPQPPLCFQVLSELPERLTDSKYLADKKKRDQQRLYAMVQYKAEQEDRNAFLYRYFMDESAG